MITVEVRETIQMILRHKPITEYCIISRNGQYRELQTVRLLFDPINEVNGIYSSNKLLSMDNSMLKLDESSVKTTNGVEICDLNNIF